MMSLFLLERTFDDYPDIVKEVCRLVRRMVVAAPSEAEARRVAGERACIEKADLWLDPTRATCRCLSETSYVAEPGVLCMEG